MLFYVKFSDAQAMINQLKYMPLGNTILIFTVGLLQFNEQQQKTQM